MPPRPSLVDASWLSQRGERGGVRAEQSPRRERPQPVLVLNLVAVTACSPDPWHTPSPVRRIGVAGKRPTEKTATSPRNGIEASAAVSENSGLQADS